MPMKDMATSTATFLFLRYTLFTFRSIDADTFIILERWEVQWEFQLDRPFTLA
jgi:hypothetical protein